MTGAYNRLSNAFHRLDDELAAGVPLPSVDAVIGRAGTLNRASTAAAIAVVSVGALGGVTAVAHAGVRPVAVAEAAVVPPTTTTTTTTTPPPAVAAPPVTTTTVAPAPAPRRTRVIVPAPRRRVVTPAPVVDPPVVETTEVPTKEGTPDPATTKPPEDEEQQLRLVYTGLVVRLIVLDAGLVVREQPVRDQRRQFVRGHHRPVAARGGAGQGRGRQSRVMPNPASHASRSWPCAAIPASVR